MPKDNIKFFSPNVAEKIQDLEVKKAELLEQIQQNYSRLCDKQNRHNEVSQFLNKMTKKDHLLSEAEKIEQKDHIQEIKQLDADIKYLREFLQKEKPQLLTIIAFAEQKIAELKAQLQQQPNIPIVAAPAIR